MRTYLFHHKGSFVMFYVVAASMREAKEEARWKVFTRKPGKPGTLRGWEWALYSVR